MKMEGVKQSKVLGAYETLRVGFENNEDIYLEISGNGNVSFDFGTHGESENLFQQYENSKFQQASLADYQNAAHVTSKADKIQQYLFTLFEAQKCTHDVHREIEEALKMYREELGV